jgi:isopenicillin N synthase-like dioxygenase
MSAIPSVDVRDLDHPDTRVDFIKAYGEALEDTGFIAVRGHGVDKALINRAYDVMQRFFALPDVDKRQFELAHAKGQRGFTSFGKGVLSGGPPRRAQRAPHPQRLR